MCGEGMGWGSDGVKLKKLFSTQLNIIVINFVIISYNIILAYHQVNSARNFMSGVEDWKPDRYFSSILLPACMGDQQSCPTSDSQESVLMQPLYLHVIQSNSNCLY